MKPMKLPCLDIAIQDGTKIAIFDLRITDVDERRAKRLIAESKSLAARVLGLASINRLETIIKNRERITFRGHQVAVRYEYPKFDEKCTQSNQTNSSPKLIGTVRNSAG